MNPPWSMIFFTTLAGAAQGLLVALVALEWASAGAPTQIYLSGAALVFALSSVALVAATFHLGHPMRAWRAVTQWRRSWLSREVIVLPAFMAVVAVWAAAHAMQWPARGWGLLAAALALLLYLCTGMIYAAVKAIAQWAHGVTLVNFLLLGLASGFTLASALAAAWHAPATATLARGALALTLLAAATRGWALARNLRFVPRTTLQTALGLRHPRIVQTSQGMTASSFGHREFSHGRGAAHERRMRMGAALLGFVLPALLLASATPDPALLALAFVVQWAGLLAERWCFFAEGQHPQNLYQTTHRATA
jgi:sulfite dehydrogenase (quinone) subunit SoeC